MGAKNLHNKTATVFRKVVRPYPAFSPKAMPSVLAPALTIAQCHLNSTKDATRHSV
jgi:hypothetical protein